jgi:hypothetical protein
VVRSVRRLRVGLPRPGGAARSACAARRAVLALVAAFAIAGDSLLHHAASAGRIGTMRETFRRRPPSCRPGSPAGDTRLAPIFLKPDGMVSVPAGARLTVA